MNYKFINVLMFAAGAAVGSAVTWKVVKTRYERIAREEIESVTESFADRFGTPKDGKGGQSVCDTECPGQINWDELEDLDEDDEDPEPDPVTMQQYEQLVYNYSSEKGGAEPMADNTAKPPYVISPYDFGELDGYDEIELTYYADGTLEDEDHSIVRNADELIGPKALNTFGEYEDDSVFVRNERLKTDFQILKDYRTYEQARSIGPGQVDDE